MWFMDQASAESPGRRQGRVSTRCGHAPQPQQPLSLPPCPHGSGDLFGVRRSRLDVPTGRLLRCESAFVVSRFLAVASA